MIEVQGYKLNPEKIPNHIAIIMDGNGRWANRNKIEKIKGHYEGLETLIKILNICKEIKVKVLTLFAFSTENWKRPHDEISGLMNLFEFFFKREFKNIKKEEIRILHSGLLDGFSPKVTNIINRLTRETAHFKDFTLNLAINYSGKIEITEATKKISQLVLNDKLSIEDITPQLISDNLFHPELNDPELLIRTSGELRISNFLLWQIAYSELWFTNKLWPEFSQKDLLQAVHDYQQRERRFGGRNE